MRGEEIRENGRRRRRGEEEIDPHERKRETRSGGIKTWTAVAFDAKKKERRQGQRLSNWWNHCEKKEERKREF